jgi:hypothetical protein
VEEHATLTLRNVQVTGAGGEGTTAAIDDYGAVELEDATLSGNAGPALWVQPGATAKVSNSTLSDGLAAAIIDDGVADVQSSTIASNKGGGIENRGKLALANTIVAENGGWDCEGRANTSDHSLDSDGTCGVGALSSRDPELGRLAGNGGPTPTQALDAGSPAIGAGDESRCPAEDQRHFTRPAGAACDIGAYQTAAVAGGASGGSGPGSGSQGAGAVSAGVSAHGRLRGRGRSRITFTLRARAHQTAATFTYTDGARRVSLRKLTLGSLAFDARRGVATLRGSAVEGAGRGRRVRVALVLVRHGRSRSLRIQLSTGYRESGALLSGSIAFTGSAA